MEVQRTTIYEEQAGPRQVGAGRPRSQVILAVIVLTTLSGALSFAQETHIGNLTGNVKRGKELYRRYCVGCHGVLGNGQGENAMHLDPSP